MKTGRLWQKDISRRTFWVLALLIVLFKLALTATQCIFVLPPSAAPIDDALMFRAAENITNGQWLGEYDWLTLSKYMIFPVWMSFLHALKIPYLIGNQLLNIVAAAVAVAALRPLVQKRLAQLVVFAAFVLNPVVSAAEVSLRLYRDSITPALALLFFAGVVGAALRYREPLRCVVGYLLAAGIGLAASYLNREDGIWLIPFMLAATVIVCIFIARAPLSCKVGKCLVWAVPYAVLAAGILAFCTLNQIHYGRFAVSDFTSKEFKDACGAMMQITSENPQDKVPVPRDVRLKLYETVPALAAIEPFMERDARYNGYGSVGEKEFGAGGFYWALRQSVYEAGFADTAGEAKEYYASVAKAINQLCDAGVLPCEKRLSTTMMPLKAKDILPILGGGFVNFGRAAVFAEAQQANVQLSIGLPEELAMYEGYTFEKANTSAVEGGNTSAYSRTELIGQFFLNAVRVLFTILLPLCIGTALYWLLRAPFMRTKGTLLPWLIALGLLLTALLRCMIVSFVMVTAFNQGVPKIMYLSAVHPLLILFAVFGTAMLFKTRKKA